MIGRPGDAFPITGSSHSRGEEVRRRATLAARSRPVSKVSSTGFRYGKSMTVTKVTVSLDPVVAERARQDVAEGRAKSLSAWLNDAGRARVEGEDLAVVLAELFDDTGGPLSEQELARARQRLALAEQR